MHVLLTGGTGQVGFGVLAALRAADHQVTALVRSDSSAAAVTAAGATPVHGDITDVAWLAGQLRSVDGAIHTASPGDASSVDIDTAVATAVATAFAGTGKPYVHTSGIWIYGSGTDITEESPWNPPALTSWRGAVEAVATSTPGARVTVVVPGVVYGYDKGLANLVTGGQRSASGALTLIGDGSQHWPTVHSDDLGVLYVRALTDGAPGRYYIGASGQNPTVRQLAEAAADGAVEPEPVDATRNRFGEAFADALLLDQQASGARARSELGWVPTAGSLVDEIAAGGYGSA